MTKHNEIVKALDYYMPTTFEIMAKVIEKIPCQKCEELGEKLKESEDKRIYLLGRAKDLAIKCKDIKYLDGKELENALIKAQMHGWEQGKKQVKTPYDFTLADDTYLKNIWKDLMKLAIPECKKCKELKAGYEKDTVLIYKADDRILELEAKCKELEDIIEGLEDDGKDKFVLNEEMDRLKAKCKDKDEQIFILKEEIDKLKANINTLKSIHYQKEVADEAVIDDLRAEVDRLKKDLDIALNKLPENLFKLANRKE